MFQESVGSMTEKSNLPNWLQWSRRIQAITQSGIQYAANPFDLGRYRELNQIAAEMMADGTGTAPGDVQIVFDAQSGYATPKLDVRGVVLKGEKILLVRELMDGGLWTLPGGFVEINESPSSAVERELREEAGVITKAKRILAVYDHNLHGHPHFPFHVYQMFIECDLVAEATPDPIETADPTYFSLRDLPKLSLPRVTPQEIKRIFELVKDPLQQTDFD